MCFEFIISFILLCKQFIRFRTELTYLFWRFKLVFKISSVFVFANNFFQCAHVFECYKHNDNDKTNREIPGNGRHTFTRQQIPAERQFFSYYFRLFFTTLFPIAYH